MVIWRVYIAMRGRMSETADWKAQGRRLRQARLRKGFESALAAAEMLGIPVGTYRNHERGNRSLSRSVALYAEKLGVSPEWLLWGREGGRAVAPRPIDRGDGVFTAPDLVQAAVSAEVRPVLMHVVADPSGRLEPDADTIELPAGAPLDCDTIIVRGQGLRPTYDDGMLLLYWNREVRPRSGIGANCVVALRAGPVVIARLEPGPKSESWTLFNVNGTGVISYDVKVDWAAPVEMVLRSTRWHEVWPRDPYAAV
jgi:hypothetical protein